MFRYTNMYVKGGYATSQLKHKLFDKLYVNTFNSECVFNSISSFFDDV